MSSIASQRRIERSRLAEAFPAEKIATICAAAILTIIIVSFRPFQPAPLDSDGQGDIVNQVGFGALGLLSVFSMASFVDRRVLSALLSPAWLALVFLLFLSANNALDPQSAMRAVTLTMIGVIAVAAALTLPRDADSFCIMLATAGFIAVGLSYAGLVALPDIAIHTGNDGEPQHAGLWRGLFSHKNIAGPIMACFSFAGIYLWRRGWTRAGPLLFVMSMVFLANTGSKTSAGVVPLAVLLVVMPGVIGMRFLVPLFVTLAIVGTGLATLGIVFIPQLAELAEQLVPDLTYTGRTQLWAFSGEMISNHPWVGYGYGSFWRTAVVMESDQHFDQLWDIRGIVHGHNGYMDIAITMGIPALIAAIFAFMILPIRDYARTPTFKENIYLADFFMMIAIFTLLNAFLESFFFRRTDPVWLFFVFAALGLRLVARFRIHTRRLSLRQMQRWPTAAFERRAT